MKDKIKQFKEHVIQKANDPNFIHHKWYVKYHLNIVQDIAFELCDTYKEADKDIVEILVWLHDYGKIVNFDNQYEETLTSGKKVLEDFGFEKDLIDKLIHYVELIDKKENLGSNETPIEVKIISSSDGAAHLIGPFFSIYWYENSDKGIEELIENNIIKSKKDWEKKIVLPEVKEKFKLRHDFLQEQLGKFPDKYL